MKYAPYSMVILTVLALSGSGVQAGTPWARAGQGTPPIALTAPDQRTATAASPCDVQERLMLVQTQDQKQCTCTACGSIACCASKTQRCFALGDCVRQTWYVRADESCAAYYERYGCC